MDLKGDHVGNILGNILEKLQKEMLLSNNRKVIAEEKSLKNFLKCNKQQLEDLSLNDKGKRQLTFYR